MPTSKSAITPAEVSTAKPRFTSPQLIRILVAVLILIGSVVIIILAVYFSRNQNQNQQQTTQSSTSSSSSSSSSSTSSLVSTSSASSSSTSSVAVQEKIITDALPIDHYFYLAKYEDKTVLYYTNDQSKKYYDGGVEKTDPQRGTYISIDSPNLGGGSAKYSQLASPRRVYATNEDLDIAYGMLNSASHHLYISMYDSRPTGNTNKMLDINLVDLSSPVVWQRELNVADSRYPIYNGAGTPRSASSDGKYLSISIGGCYFCGGSATYGTTVINILTKKETYIGEAGNVTFNLSGGTFTYHKLLAHQEACEPGPFCESGTETVYRPDGEQVTTALP